MRDNTLVVFMSDHGELLGDHGLTEPYVRGLGQSSLQEVIYWGSKEREQFAAHVMNLDGRWKYIRNRFDIDELYDLETDSDEMQNLALLPEYQPRITAMRQQIAEMICHTGPGPYDIFYGGSDGETWRIGHVRTRDFRTFEPNPHNPIFSPSPDPDAWDCDGLLTPQVIEIENRYYMVYAGMRGREWQTGIAVTRSP
jgi:hypothetical protein